MAYDRYDNRDEGRGRWRDEHRGEHRGSSPRGGQEDRGFWERAKEEVSSWFGEDDDRPGERRYGETRYDPDYEPRGRQERGGMGASHSYDRHEEERSRFGRGSPPPAARDRHEEDRHRQQGRGGGMFGGFGRDRHEEERPRMGRDRHEEERSRFGRDSDDYRPMAGDYGRSGGSRSGMGGQSFGRSQYGRQEFSQDQHRDRGFFGGGRDREEDRGRSYNYGGWGDRDSQRQSQSGGAAAFGAGAASSGGGRDEHYQSWRQRQIDELDNDYDAYRQEHQSKFENEFGGWRQQRQTKRQMLQSIREHMEVCDQDGEHVGTVDKVRGDKVILTKNDPEAGGVHRSFSCTMLERVEGNKVTLSGKKDDIRGRLQREEESGEQRDSGGGGGFFGRSEDRSPPRSSEQGPHVLERSFSGTYDDKDDQSTSRKR